MTKAELIKKMAYDAGISQKCASTALDSALEGIIAAVTAGDKIKFSGFGTFECKKRNSRTGVNPRTGDKVEIPAASFPVFKASKIFKDLVKG